MCVCVIEDQLAIGLVRKIFCKVTLWWPIEKYVCSKRVDGWILCGSDCNETFN